MSLFPNNSNRTNSEQKDKDLHPITLRLGADASLKKVMEFLPEFGFDTISPRPDYHEIYARKEMFEYTLSFIEDFGKTHLTILCYSEKRTFKLKNKLKELMAFLRDKLEKHIV